MFQSSGSRFTLIAFILAVMVIFPLSSWAGWMPESWGAPLKLKWGLDLQGGSELLYRLDIQDRKQFSNAVDVIRKRLDVYGLQEIVVTQVGSHHFMVQLPGANKDEAQQIKDVIRRTGKMDFKLLANEDDAFQVERIRELKENGQYLAKDERYDAAQDAESKQWLLLENEGGVPGKLLASAEYTTEDFNPAVAFTFNSEGARIFFQTTSQNVGRQLAIVLDGVIQSHPVIRSPINGRGVITGAFTAEEVAALVVVLNGGSLEAKPIPESENFVGPRLGQDSIVAGARACLLGTVLVMVFMTFYYLGAGLVANLAVLMNIGLIFGALILYKDATMTLPGLAGIVLTIGMSVDANILIFERIREEKAKGKTIRQALQNGFDRAFWTIFDSNLTTLITALILMFFGTGPIQGFAITLSLGLICSMFTALFVSKSILDFTVGGGWTTELRMLRLWGATKIPFMAYVKPCAITSAILVALGIGIAVWGGEEKYGIDFTGGSLVQIKLRDAKTIEEMKQRVRGMGAEFGSADVQAILEGGGGAGLGNEPSREFQIRVRQATEEAATGAGAAEADGQRLKTAVEKAFAAELAPDPFPGTDRVKASEGSAEAKERLRFKAFLELSEDAPATAEGIRTVLATEDSRLAFRAAYRKVMGSEPPDEQLAAFTSDAQVEELERSTHYAGFRVTSGPVKLAGSQADAAEGFYKELFKGKFVIAESFSRNDRIGRTVAGNLREKGAIAVFFALVAMVVYLSFRFEFRYGIGAVVALAHDVAISMGVVVLCDALGIIDAKIDLSMIAAFLTIAGYSVNDTIVVFDRIRENLTVMRRSSFEEVIDASVNQTLSRTTLTSFTTLLAVLALFIFGVDVIQGFAFAMIVGIMVGTYSSIFVASPIVALLKARSEQQAARERAAVR